MRRLACLLLVGVSISCNHSASTSPSSTATASAMAAGGDPTIGFSGLSTMPCAGVPPMLAANPSCAVRSYTESGFTVTATSGNWSVRTDYGNPAPFIEFMANGGATVNGQIQVASTAGGPFYFTSVDLYSSTTPIPYVITGTRNNAAVFTLSATLPNTFGDFARVPNSNFTAAVDRVTIALTNAAAACCDNPMGLDTIVVSSTPTPPTPMPTPPTPTPPANPTRSIQLSGNLAFGSVPVGATGQASLMIRNGGNEPLTISGLSFSDDLGTVFSSSWSGGTISPSVSHLVTIQFAPTTAKSYSGTVTVLGDQTDGTNTIAISGTGTSLPSGDRASTVTFGGLTNDGAAFGPYTEAGFNVSPTSGPWTIRTSYGNPAPYVGFNAAGGSTVTATIQVTAGGSAFSFVSVDVYSSTTPIPYAITGTRNGSAVSTLTGTMPNTFGNFKSVLNSNVGAVIDALTISLTNAAPGGGTNPMGLDNIVLAR